MQQNTIRPPTPALLTSWIARLIDPAEHVQGADARWRARVIVAYMLSLAAMLLVVLLLHLLLSELTTFWRRMALSDLALPYVLLTIAGLFGCALLARQGHERAALLCYTLTGPLLATVLLSNVGDSSHLYIGYFFAGGIVLLLVLFGLRTAALYLAYCAFWLLVVSYVVPAITLPDVLNPLTINGFVLMVTAGVMTLPRAEQPRKQVQPLEATPAAAAAPDASAELPAAPQAECSDSVTQASLQRAVSHIERLIAQMPVAVIEYDLERRIRRWNPAAEALFGYSAAQVLGQDALILVPEQEREHVTDVFARILRSDEPVYSVNDNLTREGRILTCDWVNLPLRDEQGSKVGLASLAQDVSDKLRAAERAADLLVAQDRMQTMRVLVNVVAHYFRNHMADIEVNRHLIKRLMAQGKHEDAARRLESLQRGIEQIGMQLENLAAVASAAQPVLARCDLVAVVGQAVQQRQEQAHARGFEIDYVPPSLRIEGLADAQRVRDALKQLLTSAIVRSPSAGKVRVTLEASQLWVRMAVHDSGERISTQEMQRAFDIFYQPAAISAAETTTDVLGLGIARLVAETHGGSLQLARTPDEGNIVTIVLPLNGADAQ